MTKIYFQCYYTNCKVFGFAKKIKGEVTAEDASKVVPPPPLV